MTNELNPNELKTGDEILIEQEWEDKQGNYHDEYAIITGIFDGRLQLDFGKKEINDFLKDAEFEAKDFVKEK